MNLFLPTTLLCLSLCSCVHQQNKPERPLGKNEPFPQGIEFLRWMETHDASEIPKLNDP